MSDKKYDTYTIVSGTIKGVKNPDTDEIVLSSTCDISTDVDPDKAKKINKLFDEFITKSANVLTDN